MAKFNIYILGSHRDRVIEIQSYFFKRMKHKSKIKVFILATKHVGPHTPDGVAQVVPGYLEHCKLLNDAGVACEVVPFEGGLNYMQKIDFAMKQESEYSVKLDEDLWFNENVWDWMLEHANLLDDPKNLTIAPILSNGIPTCDMFIEDFMPEAAKAELNEMIRSTHIGNFWGVDYSSLNQATVQASKWDTDYYYGLVAKLNHFYKGMHPVRINYMLNRRVNDYVAGDYGKLCDVPMSALRPEFSKRPYMCNSVFMIKTDTWRKIVADKSLFRDDFEEVPLNLYREMHDLNWVFIRNGYCLHMIYNTVCQNKYEEEFTSYCLNLTRCRYK